MSTSASNKVWEFPTHDLALPKGSLLLVAGATGYVASNVIYEALALGYRVRGTVRSEAKGQTLKEKVFAAATAAGNFETVVVSDLRADVGGFEQAVRGCAGVLHLASVVNFSSKLDEVIAPTVAGTINVLRAAAGPHGAPTVRRFVYTSSSTAATFPMPDRVFRVDAATWNDDSVAKVNALCKEGSKTAADPATTAMHAYYIYAASKTEAEQAVWQFVADNAPLPFTVNAVLPNMNTGRWYVDVVDDARVHLAALLDRTVANERVYAFARPFDWNDFIDAVHKARPAAAAAGTCTQRLPTHGKDLSIVDNARAEALLTKWFDVPGWKSIEQSVRENLEGL